MELEYVVRSDTSITHAATMEANINLMWQNSWHIVAFTKDMSTINKALTSLIHSNPTRDQNINKWRWKFSDWRAYDPCLLVNMNIAFKTWRFNLSNLSLRAWHHTMQSLQRDMNVLCEDKNPPPLVYRKKSSCEYSSAMFSY